MKVFELVKDFEYEVINGDINREISTLVSDNRKLTKDCVFVCIEGANFDGHSVVNDAFKCNAAAVIVMKNVEVPENINTAVIKVKDTREALALASAAYFSYPTKEIKVIGVTGTKGKTTTTYLIKSILENAGYKVGLIGTIETIIGDEHVPSKNTTPESYVLQETFRKMADNGIEVCVMEASSQGFLMKRTLGTEFEIGIFTNLEPDHIGPNEHDSFENYMECKSMLFRQCKAGILNADDEHLEGILKGHTCEVFTYGMSENADYRASNVKLFEEKGVLGISFSVNGRINTDVAIDMPGKFSLYNALTAVSVCSYLGIKEDAIKSALKSAKVKGRIEMVPVSDDFTLMIDYAHNAMALESLLTTLKEYESGRLVCVFGCGGNRAKSRRFEMGEVSGRLADFTIITSDNPRFEEPLDIIADIVTGIEKTDGEYIKIPDRKEAIKYAIENGRKGDIIVLAGKGHEDYQEIKGVKYPMDERVLISEVLEELK
ncbi:MAG: UDP-N-acetylmuramoyl-L-alanyl-D-glutamate--2,6-diaminopimelate ligase [Lachnospiraceae bacterium]|jgi:UDP-N-acetylmuramoyl-L-alanyl-D-glutamate--2,6-diaminopimelate ligase|nr:UDP-N-acetylmuramoyl-L-alanyl-D-glutamate--2,6-diaminopimelate ligase [Lachnospiraceae bacterium]MDY5215732.1 UDP-N-acetylmuramoyl-L-alanyl-D-glutamate--2,6-diaminopimelate ligase [Lachnospiraceae bacterium]